MLDKVDTSNGDTIKYAIGKQDIALFEANKASKTFSSSPAAYSSSDVTLSSIPLGTRTYLLRHPRTQLVVDDWNNLIFTEDEADFLNDMKLRPDMLAEIHGEDTWANTLSTHMGTIVRSKCFSDNRLVLHSDCQQTERFIAGVMEYYMTNDLRLKAIDDRELAAGDRDIEIRLDRVRDKKDTKPVMPAGVTPEKWAKDPFTGASPPLTRTAASDDITADITFNRLGTCGNNLHTRIIAVHAKDLLDGEKDDILRRTGELSVVANEGDTVERAKRALQDKYELIKNTYPRFLFFP
jgi:DNA-directed RNA polymerase subunit H (RpoH/RPB5)